MVTRERSGGSRQPSNYYEQRENYKTRNTGSHMPLDTEVHWVWRNPLNIIPAIILVCMLVALISMLLV